MYVLSPTRRYAFPERQEAHSYRSREEEGQTGEETGKGRRKGKSVSPIRKRRRKETGARKASEPRCVCVDVAGCMAHLASEAAGVKVGAIDANEVAGHQLRAHTANHAARLQEVVAAIGHPVLVGHEVR